MRAGRLRHRVQLQQLQTTQGSTGELIEEFVTVATVPAEVQPLTGREFQSASEAHAEVTTKIIIRYRSDVGTTWRVLFGTNVFDILFPADVMGRNHRLELLCKEIVA